MQARPRRVVHPRNDGAHRQREARDCRAHNAPRRRQHAARLRAASRERESRRTASPSPSSTRSTKHATPRSPPTTSCSHLSRSVDALDRNTRFTHFFFGAMNAREWACFQRIHDGDHFPQSSKRQALTRLPRFLVDASGSSAHPPSSRGPSPSTATLSPRIEDLAPFERQAAAADARRELIAQLLQHGDARVQLAMPALRQALPVGRRRIAAARQRRAAPTRSPTAARPSSAPRGSPPPAAARSGGSGAGSRSSAPPRSGPSDFVVPQRRRRDAASASRVR